MKIAFITPVTPYKENNGGPSGHPFHLLAARDKHIDLTIFSFNNNKLTAEEIKEVEDSLNAKVYIIKDVGLFPYVLKFRLHFLRLLLKYPIGFYRKLKKRDKEKILAEKPDLIWGYCAEFENIIKNFSDIPSILTLPDSVSLYYYRRLNIPSFFNNKIGYIKDTIMYQKYINLEKQYITSPHHFYHFVGYEDVAQIKRTNPNIQAFFVHHPTYNIHQPLKHIKFTQPKIKLLLAGQYNYYMQESADQLVSALTKEKDLQQYYELTFLGKGWEQAVEKLKQANYTVHHIAFAPDYIEEISKHDIQITPITIGTGTKGKVLDAFANGLLVIGTPYALENIDVIPNESCLEYTEAKDAIKYLYNIAKNIPLYQKMAESGREKVLQTHNKSRCFQTILHKIGY